MNPMLFKVDSSEIQRNMNTYSVLLIEKLFKEHNSKSFISKVLLKMHMLPIIKALSIFYDRQHPLESSVELYPLYMDEGHNNFNESELCQHSLWNVAIFSTGKIPNPEHYFDWVGV